MPVIFFKNKLQPEMGNYGFPSDLLSFSNNRIQFFVVFRSVIFVETTFTDSGAITISQPAVTCLKLTMES